MKENYMNIISFLFTHSYVFDGASATQGASIMSIYSLALLAPVLSLLYIAARALLGFATFNDARSKSNPDAVMWGVLTGVFGLIPGIIYLCLRSSNSNYVICQKCGCRHFFADANCPQCGTPSQPQQNLNPLAAQQAHKAKVQLTISIILFGIAIIAMIIGIFVFVVCAVYFSGSTIQY